MIFHDQNGLYIHQSEGLLQVIRSGQVFLLPVIINNDERIIKETRHYIYYIYNILFHCVIIEVRVRSARGRWRVHHLI